MKRIALFHNLPAGGAKRHTLEQVRELARRGYSVVEFTQSTADDSMFPLEPYTTEKHNYSFDWHELRTNTVRGMGPYVHLWQNADNLRRLSALSRQIAADIDAGGFDLVFVKDCRFTIAPYVLRYLTTPSVFYIHSLPADYAPETNGSTNGLSAGHGMGSLITALPKGMHRRMVSGTFGANLQHAGHVLTNSRFTRDVLLAHVGRRAEVVYPGVNTQQFRPQAGAETRQPYVLSAGSLLPQKGHWFVIDSLALIEADRRPQLVVATPLVHDAVAHDLRSYAAARGVALDVRCIDDSDELAAVYSGAVALTFAAHNEWLGLVALESMACGTPVVGIAEGGLLETVRDGENGFLVRRNPAEFAGALRRLLDDRSLRQRLGDAGRAQVNAYWNWSRAVDDLEAQFERVVPGIRGPEPQAAKGKP